MKSFQAFIDSSVLIEHLKGNPNARNLLQELTIKNLFKFLEANEFVYRISRDLIDKYGLLPNDALILATCKFYGVKYLVSLDDDFEYPCKREGIVLIDSAEKLKEETMKGM
ncbi:PIN domain-containing protein [Thermococcus paralvinellae]|uniref:PIN domain-containing protein n=1 Tax=Thermococcus paralvinellae TaxID=582419 RepID=W0I010_9EURY|nr:PIN domain-containing protein [Thermococcus paralvinellae]AHF79401.1 hypothetical protein containing PIN domain protein [Thermococcus paralvinellae]